MGLVGSARTVPFPGCPGCDLLLLLGSQAQTPHFARLWDFGSSAVGKGLGCVVPSVQGGMARTGGTSVLSNTLHSLKSCVTSSKGCR